MDGQVEPEQARDARRRITWAVALVGVGQFLAWSAVLAYWPAIDGAETPLSSWGTATVEAPSVGALVLLVLLLGGWVTARVSRLDRPWMSAWLSVLAVVAALLVVLFVTYLYYYVTVRLLGTDGFWRFPAIGAAIGAQLAVLLPGSGLGEAIRRLGMPVLVDIAANIVAEPLGAQTGWGALGLAIGWFVLALAIIAWMERATITNWAASDRVDEDDHVLT